MAKDLTQILLDSMRAGTQKAGRARQQKYLGFDNADQARIFRAVAKAYPKAVRITEAKARDHAEVHTLRGFMSCAVYPDGSRYRLTESGIRRAKQEQIIK